MTDFNFFFSLEIVDAIQLIWKLREDFHTTHLPPTTLIDYQTSLHQAACKMQNQIVQNWSCQGERILMLLSPFFIHVHMWA